jgi:hypothetical protein
MVLSSSPSSMRDIDTVDAKSEDIEFKLLALKCGCSNNAEIPESFHQRQHSL